MRRGVLIGALCGVVAPILPGCGPTHIVERTGSAATATPEPAQAPSTNQAADSASPTQAGFQAPPIHANYRMRTAVSIGVEYLRFGKGAGQITDLRSGSNAIAAATSFCVQYPYLASTHFRKYIYSASRSVLSLGAADYRRKQLGPWDECPGTLGPFPELEQVAQKLRECKARGEQRCVVNVEPNRRDILVLD